MKNVAKPLKKPLMERIVARDKDGSVVLRAARWGETSAVVTVSVYAYVGKTPRQLLLFRYSFDKSEWNMKPHTEQETIINNIALLTAMEHGVSDFVIRRRPVMFMISKEGVHHVL